MGSVDRTGLETRPAGQAQPDQSGPTAGRVVSFALQGKS